MLEMTVDSIRVSPMNYQRVVILKEKESDRYLPIWIGPAEADAIAVKLQDLSVPRPLTHDLIRDLVRSMEAKVLRVEVLSLKGDVFYGNIVVEAGGETIDIDSRPSDALALAVRTHVPIMVSNEVMEAAGIIPEDDLEEEINGAGESAEGEGEDRLEIFEDFLDNLDIDEEDKGGEKN